MNKLLFALCVLISAPAAAATLNFDDLNDGDLVSSVSSRDGSVSASLRVFGGAGEARVLDTANAANTPALSGPFQNDDDATVTHDPGRVLVIQEAAATASGTPDANPTGGKIIFTFLKPVDFVGFSLYNNARIKLTSNTGQVATRNVRESGAYNVFSVSGFENVTQLVFNFKGTFGALDDLRFADPKPEPIDVAESPDVISAVPLPAGLPLLLAGLGAFGILARRKPRG